MGVLLACVCTVYMRKPEENIRPLGTGVTEGRGLRVGAGNPLSLTWPLGSFSQSVKNAGVVPCHMFSGSDCLFTGELLGSLILLSAFLFVLFYFGLDF